MLISYVDESYPQRQKYYFIGAAIAEQEKWEFLDKKLVNLREEFSQLYGVSSSLEFHGHEIMGGAGGWKTLRGKHREAFGIYARALETICTSNVTFLFKGLDIKRQRNRYINPYPPYMVTMTFLLEKIDEYAKQWSSEECIVVADKNSLQDKFQERFSDYKKRGTFGYKNSRLEKVSSPLNFADSAQVIGLQAIDLALYIYQRCHCVSKNEHPKAKKSREKLWGIIAPQVSYQDIWRP